MSRGLEGGSKGNWRGDRVWLERGRHVNKEREVERVKYGVVMEDCECQQTRGSHGSS